MKNIFLLAFVSLTLLSCQNMDEKHPEKACCKKEAGKDNTLKTPLPEQSLFQIPEGFKNQNNQDFHLRQLQGKPTVLAMIFTHCGYACPRLTADIRQIEDNLKSNADDVNFVLISFDVDRDLPAQLKTYATANELGKNWTLLHGDEETVRTIAVLLNVQFEKDSEGNFSHSNLISVLDKDGVMQFQKEGLEVDQKETIQKITQLLNKAK